MKWAKSGKTNSKTFLFWWTSFYCFKIARTKILRHWKNWVWVMINTLKSRLNLVFLYTVSGVWKPMFIFIYDQIFYNLIKFPNPMFCPSCRIGDIFWKWWLKAIKLLFLYEILLRLAMFMQWGLSLLVLGVS